MLQRKQSFPKGNNKLNSVIKRALTLIISVVMILSLVPTAYAVSIPTEDSITARIKNTYKQAYAYNNNTSFKGWCAHYVNLQLYFLGINTYYVGGNGNDEYDNYKNLTKTTGGRRVHAYPSTTSELKSKLIEIGSNLPVVTDVLVGFQWTNTSAGKKYGHVLLIHAIIGEYVYFSDSFANSFNGKYYAEGAPIKVNIDTFVSYYGDSSHYEVEGLIWFEDEELTAAQGGIVEVPPSGGDVEEDTPTVDIPAQGRYQVTNVGGLHLRDEASTSGDSFGVMPYNTVLDIIEIKNGWGRTVYEGNEGWCSLDYTKRIGDLSPVVSEKRKDGTLVSIDGFDTLSAGFESIDKAEEYTYTFTLTSDVTLDADITVSDGVTIKIGSKSLEVGEYSIRLVSGGTVTAESEVEYLHNNPFVTASSADGVYTYYCNVALAVTTASLVIKENIALRFSTNISGVDSVDGVEYFLICEYADGSILEYAPSSKNEFEYHFTTDGIPAKKMGDEIVARVCARVEVSDKVYEALSDPISYSPAAYVNAVYGSGSKLDSFMSAMLNYGTAAQKYFGYNTSSPSNIVIPEADRAITADTASLILANAPPPVFTTNTSVSIQGASLVVDDTIALRFTAPTTASNFTLLVWSEADYQALAAKAASEGGDIADYLVAGTATEVLKNDGGEFTLYGISAKKFADTYYFRLCEETAEGNKYDFVISYSVTAYCHYQVNDGVANDIDELCLAIAAYSEAARTYFNYTVNAG